MLVLFLLAHNNTVPVALWYVRFIQIEICKFQVTYGGFYLLSGRNKLHLIPLLLVVVCRTSGILLLYDKFDFSHL